MVNYSTNIKKSKQSLNNDGQLFHQYQQIKQLPLILTQCIQKGGWGT